MNNMILDFVLDTEGFSCEVECPQCNKKLVERQFDELLGGTINNVYSYDCPHCGYHACNQGFCSICEQQYEQLESDRDMQFDVFKCEDYIEIALEEMVSSCRVNAVLISNIKLLLLKYPNELFTLGVGNRTAQGNSTLKRLTQLLLNIRFEQKLNYQIALAKHA